MLNFGTRTQGCQQPSVVNSMQQGAVEGTDVCLLVTAACSSVAATVCPWPPWQLRDPSLPTPLGPAPASCCLLLPAHSHQRKTPPPDLHLGRGVWGKRTAPHSLALEGYTSIPGGIRWSLCTLNIFGGTQYTFSSSFLFRTLWSSHTHNCSCPWGPRAPLQSPGRDSGHSGT